MLITVMKRKLLTTRIEADTAAAAALPDHRTMITTRTMMTTEAVTVLHLGESTMMIVAMVAATLVPAVVVTRMKIIIVALLLAEDAMKKTKTMITVEALTVATVTMMKIVEVAVDKVLHLCHAPA